jgi:hypothetical protein
MAEEKGLQVDMDEYEVQKKEAAVSFLLEF